MATMKVLAATLLVLVGASGAMADQVVAKYEGGGSESMRPCTTTGPWELQWTVGKGVFYAYVHDATTGRIVDTYSSDMAGGSGTGYSPKPGSYWLQVNASTTWKVAVVAIAP